MPDRSSKKRVEDDLEEAPQDDGKNPAAVALGRLGGKKGGKARAKKLSPERRSEIASLAAQARWQKTNDDASEK